MSERFSGRPDSLLFVGVALLCFVLGIVAGVLWLAPHGYVDAPGRPCTAVAP